ncbi:hypothetical protein GCM10023142_24090 [Anaerocolumna aminovalerica]|uniref:Nitrogen regulatory protein P-II family n=1 Tax=Anaerocolumna aminovalerica TaxID=1527 RepID=A0A1I5IPC3_9FIRM|nr:hypothetical protein [Anaerocolumna aminovalerica]SFO62377.1 hypothetical protein SAMN04489757_14910 [Anaerocolumna aminovalerica]
MIEFEYGIDFLTLIAGRKYKDEILKLLLNSECHLIDVVYAKGSIQTGYFKDMLGLVPEEKKVLITCLIADNLSAKVLEQLVTKFNFDKPNTGVAFVVPVDKLSL